MCWTSIGYWNEFCLVLSSGSTSPDGRETQTGIGQCGLGWGRSRCRRLPVKGHWTASGSQGRLPTEEDICTESWKSNSFPSSLSPTKNGLAYCLAHPSWMTSLGENSWISAFIQVQFCHVPALWFWASHLASECLFPLLCNGANAYFTSLGCFQNWI